MRLLRRSGTRIDPETTMFSWWWLEVDRSGNVDGIILFDDTVEELFNVGDLAAPEVALALAAHFGIKLRPYPGEIPELLSAGSRMWFTSGWAHVDRTQGWILAVSSDKHVTVQRIVTTADVTF